MRKDAKRIANRYSGVIHNFLKFPGSLGALVCGQIRLAPYVNRIERSKVRKCGAARHAKVKGNVSLEKLDRLGSIAMVQRERRANGRKVVETDRSVLREISFQIISKRLGLGRIARHGQHKGCAIPVLSVLCKCKRSH